VKGRFYRTVSDVRRAQVASPVGSSKVGGRYHTVSEDQVLYLADSPTLSMGEATQIFRTVPIDRAAWYTATFEVGLEQVLDLTAPKVLGRIEITLADLVQSGPPGFRLPQTIATAARGRGFTAILAPTARPGLQVANLVVFFDVVDDPEASVRLLG
jgi:RES domain-containing protein